MAPPTRDFAKRPKAKVGKRAPNRMNATDTSFKTASVAVRSQGKSLDKNKATKDGSSSSTTANSAAARMELASSRGNALSTLQMSLRHHAPAVRASGLKGIRDSVQSLSSLEDTTLGTSILEANLPSLLPNMCRCWLDEDDDVRSLAIQLFGDVLKNLRESYEQSDLKCLVPFVPFLCAYASSALNSLDRDIRKDGALIVGMMASSDSILSFASLSSSDSDGEKETKLSAMSIEMGKHVDLFIPSLERLLKSMSLGGRRGNAGSKDGGLKKRKRDGNTTASQSSGSTLAASDSTILSLGLLLRASLVSNEGNEHNSNANSGMIRRRLDPSLFVSGESTFLKGGSAQANALLLFQQGGRQCNDTAQTPIRNIWDLPTMPSDDLVGERENIFTQDTITAQQFSSPESDTPTKEKIQRLCTLLETLRMKFVELTHTGRSHEKGGLILPTAHLDTVDILVQTIRFVHQQSQSYQKLIDTHQLSKKTNATPVPRVSKKNKKKAKVEEQDMGECITAYQTTVSKTLTLLLETFPVHPMGNDSLSRYELTNAGLCSALAELGGDCVLENHSRESSSQWISSVFAYILPRLHTTENNATENDNPERIATNMLLKVVSKLLLPHGSHEASDTRELTQRYLLDNPLKRYDLFQAFASSFFPSIVSDDAQQQKVIQLASTAMGRTAAMLLTTLVTQSANSLLNPSTVDDNNNLHEKNSLLIMQMVSVLPYYLISWEEKLPEETGLVLSSIISIVRQWNENEPNDDSVLKKALNDLCVGLRKSLEALYITTKKQPSIFARLPEQVQKLCVGLIGLLKSPSEALSKSLATICSRSSAQNSSEEDVQISDNMANYIVEVMHSLRKTMSMPYYITFLIDSCGIKRANSTMLERARSSGEDAAMADPLYETVFSFDKSVVRLCRFLTTSCDQPSIKILPMIRPILEKWLLDKVSPTTDVFKQLVQARTAISILAAFTWDEALGSQNLSSSVFIDPVFLKLDEKFDRLLINSVISQFELTAQLWTTEGGGYMDDLTVQHNFLARLLGPVTLLLRYRQGMFGQFIQDLSGRVVQQREEQKPDEEPVKQINVAEVHMKALLLVLKSKDPASIVELVRSSNELQTDLLLCAEAMEKAVGGHLNHISSKLVHRAKLCKS